MQILIVRCFPQSAVKRIEFVCACVAIFYTWILFVVYHINQHATWHSIKLAWTYMRPKTRIETINNKKRSRTARFSANEAQKCWSNTHEIISKKKPLIDRKVPMETLSEEFEPLDCELWALGSTKYECQMDSSAFCNHQDSNRRDAIRDCSL